MNKSKGSHLLSCKKVSQYACKLKFWRFLDRLRRETAEFDSENRFRLGCGEIKEQEAEKSSKESAAMQWQWQSMLAHQELFVIIDLIKTISISIFIRFRGKIHLNEQCLL
ncbi:hypothetical protein DVH24_013347 [Malus domestica]|uniref:Uncharacterized protein n=1 Tax=Malus domestica TaxID=3750 RepID=A0A498HN71_MALDO|nr:hypothetical protein DVH24_013347 [Malus domestica]